MSEVKILGFKNGGDSAYNWTVFLGTLLIAIIVATVLSSFPIASAIFVVVAIIAMPMLIVKLNPRSISYDASTNRIIKNSQAKFSFLKKDMDMSLVTGVRIRRVRIVPSANLVDMIFESGTYDVISFASAVDKMALNFWFNKKGNMEQFLPILEKVINDKAKQAIVIDKKSEKMSEHDFLKE